MQTPNPFTHKPPHLVAQIPATDTQPLTLSSSQITSPPPSSNPQSSTPAPSPSGDAPTRHKGPQGHQVPPAPTSSLLSWACCLLQPREPMIQPQRRRVTLQDPASRWGIRRKSCRFPCCLGGGKHCVPGLHCCRVPSAVAPILHLQSPPCSPEPGLHVVSTAGMKLCTCLSPSQQQECSHGWGACKYNS